MTAAFVHEDDADVAGAVPEMIEAAMDVLEVPPPMKPSEFAEAHRHLKDGTTFRPGLWSNDVFPYLVDIMDLVEEAIRLGKRGLVLMKSAQGGGSEGMINALAWIRVYFGGPMLYLISKDDIAGEFSRDRFDHLNRTCEPVRKKHLSGYGSGENLLKKRYVDGKLVIAGGQSILNIESLPYPWVFIDEPDSLPDQVKGKGDPFKVAELRTEGWMGPTLMVAFSHPTTRDRGTGKVYYTQSDQRRGFIDCPHCDGRFWLDPQQIEVFPKEGQTRTAAERDPDCYLFVTPCCGVILTDTDRISAIANGMKQESTLPPSVAETKEWIGVHFNQLCMSNKTMRQIAAEMIQGLDDENVKVVVVNKRFGDVHDGDIQSTPIDDWKALRVKEGSDDFYLRGEVPADAMFLLGGQDNGISELHWSVWAFGIVLADGGHPLLCMWLVDYGVEDGPRVHSPKRTTLDSADLAVLDQVLYEALWPHASGDWMGLTQCGHDSGWQPSAVLDYCAIHRPRSVPTRGAAVDENSNHPLLRWSSQLRWRVGKTEKTHPDMRRADLNTFQLKRQFHGMAQRRFVDVKGRMRQRIYLPENTEDAFLEHLSSERLVTEKSTRVWKPSGPNHWLDTGIIALGLSGQVQPHLGNETRESLERRREAERLKKSARRRPHRRSIRTRY